MTDTTRDAIMLKNLERMKKLVVIPHPHEGTDWLLVDAAAIVTDEHDVRYWSLATTEVPGVYVHPESANVGPLGGHLWAIASVYTSRETYEANTGTFSSESTTVALTDMEKVSTDDPTDCQMCSIIGSEPCAYHHGEDNGVHWMARMMVTAAQEPEIIAEALARREQNRRRSEAGLTPVRSGSSTHGPGCARANPDPDLPADVPCTCRYLTEYRLLESHLDAAWLVRCGDTDSPGNWTIPGGFLPIMEGGEIEVDAYPIWAVVDEHGAATMWSAHLDPTKPDVQPCWEWRFDQGWDDHQGDQATIDRLDDLGGSWDDRKVSFFVLGDHQQRPTITPAVIEALAVLRG